MNFFSAMKKGGYTTVAITEFDQYTSLNANHIYDISNYNNECKVPYFIQKYSNNDIYKNILNLNFK